MLLSDCIPYPVLSILLAHCAHCVISLQNRQRIDPRSNHSLSFHFEQDGSCDEIMHLSLHSVQIVSTPFSNIIYSVSAISHSSGMTFDVSISYLIFAFDSVSQPTPWKGHSRQFDIKVLIMVYHNTVYVLLVYIFFVLFTFIGTRSSTGML